LNGSTKQETLSIGCESARSAIDPSDHLWFAVVVSLALHGLFLTALALKSHLTPAYHPAMYGTGNGPSVVRFISGTLDGPAKVADSKEEAAFPANAKPSLAPSVPVEVSESPLPMEEEPVEEAAVQLGTIPETQRPGEPFAENLSPAPTVTGPAVGERSGGGSVLNETGAGGSDGESDGRSGATGSGGNAGSFGIPAYLRNPLPPYPRLARERRWEGTTILQVVVFDDGSDGQVEIIKSSGHEILDEAAVTTVRRWKFLPARSGNTPVRSLIQIPIRFQMADN
jgi:protein TonB